MKYDSVSMDSPGKLVHRKPFTMLENRLLIVLVMVTVYS